MPCPNSGGILIGTTPTDAIAYPCPCNRWDCPYCGYRKSKALRGRLKRYRPERLLTLTCNPGAFHSPQDAYAHMSKAFTSLSKLIRHTFPGQEWAYIIVWEQTKKGWPHIHALVKSPYIAQVFLSKAWAHLTGAPVVDIRRADRDLRLHTYLVKYLTKQISAPRGFRRFRTSYRAIDPPPSKSNGDNPDKRVWFFRWASLQEVWGELELLGYIPHWVNGVTLYGPHITAIPPG